MGDDDERNVMVTLSILLLGPYSNPFSLVFFPVSFPRILIGVLPGRRHKTVNEIITTGWKMAVLFASHNLLKD